MASVSPVSFSVPQRILHWAVALLVFFNLLFPDGMSGWYRTMRRGGTPSPEQLSSANIHAYVGIAILVLAVLRLCLRWLQGVPEEPAAEPLFLRIVAKLVHAGLYLLIFAMPISGIAAYYFGANSAAPVHADVLKIILWVLIAAHVAGALVHQFYWKTGVLRRMTIG